MLVFLITFTSTCLPVTAYDRLISNKPDQWCSVTCYPPRRRKERKESADTSLVHLSGLTVISGRDWAVHFAVESWVLSPVCCSRDSTARCTARNPSFSSFASRKWRITVSLVKRSVGQEICGFAVKQMIIKKTRRILDFFRCASRWASFLSWKRFLINLYRTLQGKEMNGSSV